MNTLTETAKTGMLGEIAAARYLRDLGCEIVTANYRTKAGEVDIAALEGDTLVIAEVKTRSAGGMFPPSEAVDRAKEEKVRSAAAPLISAVRGSREIKSVRYDIIEVAVSGEKYEVTRLENAF